MKRKLLSVVTAVVLCTAVVAGATLAYLNKMVEKDNTFIYDTNGQNPDAKAFNGEMAEPSWSPDAEYQFTGVTNPNPNPTYGKWGEELAKDFLPGRLIPKDPTVRNTGEKHDIFVGMIVDTEATATAGATTLTLGELESKGFININYNTTDWKEVNVDSSGKPKNADKRYFVYIANNGVLPSKGNNSGATADTTPLFTNVTVGPNADRLKATDEWNLRVRSYMTQAENEAWDADPANASNKWSPETAMIAQYGQAADPSNPFDGEGHWTY